MRPINDLPDSYNPSNDQQSEIIQNANQLPKGCGAIAGRGEKFSVNPVSGTGTLTIPIYCSPGRSGFSPSLSLNYNSNVR